MEEFKQILEKSQSKLLGTPSRSANEESGPLTPVSDCGETLEDLAVYLETPLPSRVPTATPASCAAFHNESSVPVSSLRDYVIKLEDLMVDDEVEEKRQEEVSQEEKAEEQVEVVELETEEREEEGVEGVSAETEEVEHEAETGAQEVEEIVATEQVVEEPNEMQLDQEIVQEVKSEKVEERAQESVEESAQVEESEGIEEDDSFYGEEEEEGLEEMEEEERRIEEEEASRVVFTPLRARKSVLEAVAPLTPSSARRKPERIFVPAGEVSPVAILPRTDYTPIKKSPIQFKEQEIIPRPEDDEDLLRAAEEEISRALQRVKLEEAPKPSTPLRLTLLKTPQRAQRIPNPDSPALESFKTPMAKSVKKEPRDQYEEVAVTPLRFADVATPSRDQFYTPKEEEEEDDDSYYQDAIQSEVQVKEEFHTSRRSREQETPLGLVYGLEEKRKVKVEDDEVIIVTPVRRSTRINNLTAERIKFSAQRDKLQFEPNKRIPEKTDIRSVMNFEMIEDSDEEN
eukprot:TRINITY_DN4736_c0_g1_i1.p1 TRINITY_DN4736_c0_g1~~TRINITY_DN4736_c0_g1_i1.p1  ORF type:complete len:514 (-),score=274.65 TRINITY_DN4736_c0_g1_i1:242-1783(-)